MKNCIAIDIETSGLDAERDFVIKVMATKVKAGEVIEKFSSFVFCPEKLSSAVVELTGISDADLEHAPTLDAVMEQFELFRKGLPLVAYNAEFAKKFLKKYRFIGDIEDVATISKNLHGMKDYQLKTIARYFNIPYTDDDDSETIAKIYLKF